jgi:erythromycin esterase-like protein
MGSVAQDEQNVRLVKNAERYYRAMSHGHVLSWNLRDRYMAETLDALGKHFRQQGRAPKFVVWAHNSHLSDARVTDMHARGELNLGQLVRERDGNRTVLVGFSTIPAP